MVYQPAKKISLKAHPEFNEAWLQELITNNPSVLGLPGEPTFYAAEHPAPYGGRLDLILVDDELHRRYEVEVQLGRTDPSHIIRTIEYWDHERIRRPTWDHVAVLAAEDVTSRFSNVIRLFNASIPIMAIEINAIEVAGHVTIAPVTVLDLTAVEAEDEGDGEQKAAESATRAYWESRSSPESMAIVDGVIELIREVIGDPVEPRYNKRFIGQTRRGRPDNLAYLGPRKKPFVLARFRTPRTEELTTRLEDDGFDVLTGFRPTRTIVRLRPEDMVKNRATIIDLIRMAADLPETNDDVDVDVDTSLS
jgi:hypothetical protein